MAEPDLEGKNANFTTPAEFVVHTAPADKVVSFLTARGRPGFGLLEAVMEELPSSACGITSRGQRYAARGPALGGSRKEVISR